MGKKSSPPPPATPDYQALAAQQADIDKDTAAMILDSSRINQTTPMGQQTWSQADDGRWSVDQTLSEGQQQMFDTAQGLNIGVGQAATDALGDYTSMIGAPLDFSGAPERMGPVQAGEINRSINPAEFGDRFDPSAVDPRAAAMEYVQGLDLSGLAAIPGSQDYGGQRQEVIDSMMNLSESRLNPQFAQQEEAMRNRLLNSGVREGTEAWNQAWDQFARERTGAYGEARDRAVLAGGQEQSRMLADALGIRGQGFGEQLAGGNFANQATNLANQYGMQVRGQDFGEAISAAQQGDSEALNRLNAEMAALGFENDAQALDFQQQIAASGMNEQQRNTAIQEMLMERQIPMNELAGIISASGQFGLPQFGQSSMNVPQYSGADVLGAGQAGFDAEMAKYNADTAGSNAKKGNMGQMGGALGSAAINTWGSDKRFKKNIEPIGKIKGHYFYVWDWNDKAKMYGVSTHPRVGVMAQEVQKTHPEAIVEIADGYMAVDYSQIWEEK